MKQTDQNRRNTIGTKNFKPTEETIDLKKSQDLMKSHDLKMFAAESFL